MYLWYGPYTSYLSTLWFCEDTFIQTQFPPKNIRHRNSGYIVPSNPLQLLLTDGIRDAGREFIFLSKRLSATPTIPQPQPSPPPPPAPHPPHQHPQTSQKMFNLSVTWFRLQIAHLKLCHTSQELMLTMLCMTAPIHHLSQQAIVWTNAELMIGHFGSNLSEM